MTDKTSHSLPLRSTVTLLAAARHGNNAAVAALYRRHLHPLRRWARGRLPRNARALLDTDDLVQNSLMNALRRLDSLELARTGAFQAYLRKSVLNGIRDEFRRHRRRPSVRAESHEIPSQHPSPTEEIGRQEQLDRYEHALGSLAPGDRELIVARLELGAGYADIARDFNKPSSDAARMAVKRAVLRLAQAIREHGHP